MEVFTSIDKQITSHKDLLEKRKQCLKDEREILVQETGRVVDKKRP